MTEAAVVGIEPTTSASPLPGLEALANEANRQHKLGCEAARLALGHWIKAGEALHAARGELRSGSWSAWLRENFDGGYSTALACMRFASYADILQGDESIRTVHDAQRALRGLPSKTGGPGRVGYSPEVRLEARALDAGGMSQGEISRTLGVDQRTVRGWLDPRAGRELSSKRKQRAKRRRDEERTRRQARAVKKAGGAGAVAYGFVRRALQELDSAEGRDFDAAIAALYEAEDAIAGALGATYGKGAGGRCR